MNHLIDTQEALDGLSELLSNIEHDAGFVAVDTEFFRERTYHAKLCLVQLGIGEHQYCIDVLSINDLTLLVELFANENVTKIFHAARQDLEVIYETLNIIPKPIFDTQLAGAFFGVDMQIGYAAFVELILDIKLDKSQGRTDWTKRPLSEAQIKYAGDDVAYLGAIYQYALSCLNNENKENWYFEEIQINYNPDSFFVTPENAYKRLYGGALKPKQQTILKELAGWREATAKKNNIPRTWVCRDDKLFDLAIKQPSSKDQLFKLQVFNKKISIPVADELLDLIANTESSDELIWKNVEPLTKLEKGYCTQMMKQLSSISKQENVAQALLATRKDIESLFRNRRSTKLLNGWREEVVGKPLLDFLADKAA